MTFFLRYSRINNTIYRDICRSHTVKGKNPENYNQSHVVDHKEPIKKIVQSKVRTETEA